MDTMELATSAGPLVRYICWLVWWVSIDLDVLDLCFLRCMLRILIGNDDAYASKCQDKNFRTGIIITFAEILQWNMTALLRLSWASNELIMGCSTQIKALQFVQASLLAKP